MTRTSLTAFLLARFAEDQAEAAKAYDVIASTEQHTVRLATMYVDGDIATVQTSAPGVTTKIASRLHAECLAKQRILAAHPIAFDRDHPVDGYCTTCQTWDGDVSRSGLSAPCDTLAALASVYADHPHFQEEWRA
jgi:hypothetical protein